MVASTMLKGGFSNRTLQYADVSSMTRTCAAISVMIRSLCNEDVHERGSRSDGAWQPLRAAGAGKESEGHGLAFARAASTCARTVRAAPAAAVFTALGGIQWMYAPVLFKCVAQGFSTPSAFSNARVSSSAS